MKDRLLNFIKSFGYVFLFIFSFGFFLYFTFPYGVLKEALVSKISSATGLVLRVDELGPSFPLGFEVEGVEVLSSTGGPSLNLNEVELNLSLLQLLIGRLAVNVELTSENEGVMDVYSHLNILPLISDNNFLPSRIEIVSEKFDIGNLATHFIYKAGDGPKANPLTADFLKKMTLEGLLNGSIDFDLDQDQPTQSSGKIDIKIVKGEFMLNDPSLNISDQVFKKAMIKAVIQKGQVKIIDKSGVHSEELFVDLKGKIKLNKKIARSSMDLGLDIKLKGRMNENFGFILQSFGGSDGQINYKIKGILSNPNWQSD